MLTGGVRALRAVCLILGTLFAPRKIYSIQPESACSPFRRDLLGHYMSESNTQVVPCGKVLKSSTSAGLAAMHERLPWSERLIK